MSDQTTARCPYCMKDSLNVRMSFRDGDDRVQAGRCGECGRLVVRVNNEVVYPFGGSPVSPEEFEDLPAELKDLCTEACSAAEVSPRAACSLLAPYVERICDHLGAKGKTLGEKLEDLRRADKLPEELGRTLTAAAGAKTGEEEIDDAKEQAYDLIRVSHYLAPQAADFWPSS